MTTPTAPYTAPELADLPAQRVLAVDGAGPPDGPEFAAAVARLYAALGADVPLQGTWWSGTDDDTDAGPLDLAHPAGWRWTLVLPTGDRAGPDPTGDVRVETRPAQRVVRLLHHGPYADEAPSLAALYAFAASAGLQPAGPHTEVYLTDPRVVAPSDLRTELRLPVR